ncbi:MAG: hypothetical protein QOD40_1108 [Alphaproteobacteria bacterium]|jgi:hypothetical protein|nr:hypothetical protein [Alphaproteobacteria bacterium]
MFKIITSIAAAALLFAATANRAEARKSQGLHSAEKAHADGRVSARSHYTWGNYRDVRGFNHRARFYVVAYAPPTISSFPMPFTVWY